MDGERAAVRANPAGLYVQHYGGAAYGIGRLPSEYSAGIARVGIAAVRVGEDNRTWLVENVGAMRNVGCQCAVVVGCHVKSSMIWSRPEKFPEALHSVFRMCFRSS